MSSNFKEQAAQQRVAIPQIDPETTKSVINSSDSQVVKPVVPQAVENSAAVPAITEKPAKQPPVMITQVDTAEMPSNRGFSMYPSRHRQIAKDLAYIEDRKPWEIIDDALEEYVTRHYGKQYKRHQSSKPSPWLV
ncbi:MAG TPA: hypothetical protein VMR95_04660 [Candidatus Binatia bacterium]|nr:hypothetical protein [Candidatus Binatia bacterium]